MDATVGFPGDSRAHRVGHTQGQGSSLEKIEDQQWDLLLSKKFDADLFTISQRQKGVCSLSWLWDQDAHIIPERTTLSKSGKSFPQSL